MAITIPEINISAPKITCSLTNKLETLNLKKDSLKNSIKNLASVEINSLSDLTTLANRFADVQAQADSLKLSLKEAIPIPPQVENFQSKMKELTNLAATAEGRINAEIYKQVDNLKKKFTGSVPGLEKILKQSLQGGGQIDICSLPNVDLIPSSIPGLPPIPKVKPPAALIPTDVPPVVEAKKPTVVKKIEQKSSGEVQDAPINTIILDKVEHDLEFKEKFITPYMKDYKNAKKAELKAQKKAKKFLEAAKKAGYTGGIDGIKAGFKHPDIDKYRAYLDAFNKRFEAVLRAGWPKKFAHVFYDIIFKQGYSTVDQVKASEEYSEGIDLRSYLYYDSQTGNSSEKMVPESIINPVIEYIISDKARWMPYHKLLQNKSSAE